MNDPTQLVVTVTGTNTATQHEVVLFGAVTTVCAVGTRPVAFIRGGDVVTHFAGQDLVLDGSGSVYPDGTCVSLFCCFKHQVMDIGMIVTADMSMHCTAFVQIEQRQLCTVGAAAKMEAPASFRQQRVWPLWT